MDSTHAYAPPVDEELAPPSVLTRIAASIIDGLLFAPLILILSFGFNIKYSDDAGILILMVAYLVYEVVAIATYGTTVGKKAMGLKVVSLGGTTPSWTASLIRYVVKNLEPIASIVTVLLAAKAAEIVDGLLFVYLIAILVSIAVASDRRGWHDKAAGVRVTYNAKGAAKQQKAENEHQPAVPTWLNEDR